MAVLPPISMRFHRIDGAHPAPLPTHRRNPAQNERIQRCRERPPCVEWADFAENRGNMPNHEAPIGRARQAARSPRRRAEQLPICLGRTKAGTPCQRVPAPGEKLCYRHAPRKEPEFRFKKWTVEIARRVVWWFDPALGSRKPSAPLIKRTYLMAYEEGRRFLAVYDPDWLGAFDAGEVPPEPWGPSVCGTPPPAPAPRLPVAEKRTPAVEIDGVIYDDGVEP